ncbi:MAG TPA: phytanoyl-CoA dioxygenase family protein, partial [Stellaceae bacterium]
MTPADPPLTEAQRRQFASQGFVVLRDAVPATAVAAARARIDAALAADRSIGRNREYAEKSYCPDILETEEILALFEGRPRAAVDALFGRSGLARLTNAQIALRPPEYRSEIGHSGAHIDGFPSAANGIPARQIGRHTAIVGVFLSRAEQPGMGNLWVWPGSHRPMAEAMRRLEAPQLLAEHGAEALHAAAIEAAVRLADGIELAVEPGDAVLCHHLLAHAVGGNLSVQTPTPH